MKTKLTSALLALSITTLVVFTLSSCESGRRRHGDSGWHNMGVGPKAYSPMPDENMPGRR